ncbi:MAG TPA: class I SAM-dependent methyltransferase [Cytophagaceae bacterium]|jgi:ubiquinone/menaquinone biosynthesis C-methylase UbiE|nr:class I SAM-dependent methyltransferase [Cytophagaceae bacterium]
MDKEALQQLAQQLRKPAGDLGKKVGENMNTSNALMNMFTIDELHLQNNDCVLEIGMGNGFFVKHILEKEPSISYYGCDYSELMVAEATTRNQSFVESGQARFMMASADHLPFEQHSFDKAFTINTIYFWSNPSNELTEIHRVLKHNGKLFLTVRSQATMSNIPVTQFGFKIYSKKLLTDLLQATGFEVKDVLEKEEPDMTFSGNTTKVSTWIFCAEAV